MLTARYRSDRDVILIRSRKPGLQSHSIGSKSKGLVGERMVHPNPSCPIRWNVTRNRFGEGFILGEKVLQSSAIMFGGPKTVESPFRGSNINTNYFPEGFSTAGIELVVHILQSQS